MAESDELYAEAATKVVRDKAEGSEKFEWVEQWYPIAVSGELEKGMPHAATIIGRDIVVWWDKKGSSWQVFDDKCPHRLAPLSEGRIDEQGQLQCCYHGWSFAPCTGACTSIPQAPPDRSSLWESKHAYATVYPSIEQQGIIWFCPDTRSESKDLATRRPPPFIPALSDTSFVDALAMRDLPYGYEQLIENLMDPAHVPFAHHGLQGDRRQAKPLKFKVENFEKSGFSGKYELGGTVFKPPCLWELHVEFPSLQSKDKTGDAASKKKIVMIFICIPLSPGRSRLIWSFRRNFGIWIDYLRPLWFRHITQMLVLDSDLYLLHLAERKLDKLRDLPWEKACYVPTSSDAFVIAFRKWLKMYAGGAPDWGNNYNGDLPPVVPKEQLMDRYSSHVVICRSCRRALHFFQVAEKLLQILSVGLAAALGAIALKPLPGLRNWSILLVFAAVLCSAVSIKLSRFIKKNFYFHDYKHALVK